MSADRPDPDEVFDFYEGGDYRPYQRAALHEAANALWSKEEVSNVVLNLPTGIGKSPINVALARQSGDAFITTPQKALRTQLERDADLNPYYSTLRSRVDYNCLATTDDEETYDCKDCPVNRSDEQSCINTANCTYWNRKEDAMSASVASITFSYLIVDGYLPVSTEDNKRVSFGNRELLVVDECHKLEGQVASLHAGFKVSPHTLPDRVFAQVDQEVGELPDDDVTELDDVRMELNRTFDRAVSYISDKGSTGMVPEEESLEVQACRNFKRKFKWAKMQVDKGRPWVVSREETTVGNNVRYSIHVQPVDVDKFLQEHVWSRADKRVLSTATMPFASDPDRWVTRLGLDPAETHVVQYPMPFPAENRPIYTDKVVGKMSSGGWDTHADEVVKMLESLSHQHRGEKGLIHTASYDRAQQLGREFRRNSRVHNSYEDTDLSEQIERWLRSDDDMFFSPAATDGVDLPYEDCRWQALVKVPYPHMGDPRTRYMMDERNAWDWYYETTAQDIQQSVGRGVRAPDDDCAYYVLDASFFDVLQKVDLPDWFTDAIHR
ncbi:helicase C-terminal domain-containing protein [Natronomonas gomsonensis]|uniref:helicase C-terminal domain-containing protein n=1 Tax=Natronomonas gomsonensis TaxID=1046043 RepID=UPI0015BEACDD|nr:helicase C-terminal domain-containing protein [Natronomonas gomsonensis]